MVVLPQGGEKAIWRIAGISYHVGNRMFVELLSQAQAFHTVEEEGNRRIAQMAKAVNQCAR